MSTFLANDLNLLLSCALEDIQPINGFKWTVGGWDLLVEKGVTDDEGWQYARKWSLLRDSKKPYDHQTATVRIYYLSFFCFLFFSVFIFSLRHHLVLCPKKTMEAVHGNKSRICSRIPPL
jgi:hypothetical protein